MNKWIQWAEVFDSWRVFPRLLVAGYCFWYAHFLDQMWVWYAHLPLAEQSPVNAGMFTAVGAVLTFLGGQVFNIYIQNGRDWNAQPATTVTTLVSKSTAPP